MDDNMLRERCEEHRMAGELDEALACAQEASRRNPNHPGILLELIRLLSRAGEVRTDEPLVAAVQNLLRNNPASIDRLGEEFQKLHLFGHALSTFRMLAEFPQADVRAVGSSREAALFRRMGMMSEAWQAIHTAESLSPNLPEVLYAKALVIHDSSPLEAREILNHLATRSQSLPDPFNASCASLMAVACDKLGLEDQAMAALETRRIFEERNPAVSRLRQQRAAWREWHKKLLDLVGPGHSARSPESDGGKHPRHALLLGHPRSGTTLLEQILDAHPEVRSVDEADTYQTIIESAWIRNHSRNGQGMDFTTYLNSLPEESTSLLRTRYLTSLARVADTLPSTSVLIDKNPALTVNIGGLRRVLPDSRFVVMLRDPRDVCLSACFLGVERTPWSVNWLTLEEAVDQYVFVMDLWRNTRCSLTQPWMEVRYETLVQCPIDEGTRVTRFLGLDWSPPQADPASHSMKRVVQSPTHHEVRKPVHGDAVARWKRYRHFLEPFRDKLAPFIADFGYPED